MGSILKVVPVDDYDVAWHEDALRGRSEHRFEYDDGSKYPPDEELAADLAAFLDVKHGLEALTAAQRKASRWPTKDELRAALGRLATQTGGTLWFSSDTEFWSHGSVTVYSVEKPDRIETSVSVLTSSQDETYYCEGYADMLRAFANEVAKVAGHQVTFFAEDYSPAAFTALVPMPTAKTTSRPARPNR